MTDPGDDRAMEDDVERSEGRRSVAKRAFRGAAANLLLKLSDSAAE